jgi:hypothetical protein|tara:strand:- start:27 stop:344 length:318 start_codon:yes stop_codon:yes gene_type:complete
LTTKKDAVEEAEAIVSGNEKVSVNDSEIDKLLADAMKKETYQKEYNQRPEVKEGRKNYNKLRQAKQKVGALLLHDQITKEQAQFFVTQINNKIVPDLDMYKVKTS